MSLGVWLHHAGTLIVSLGVWLRHVGTLVPLLQSLPVQALAAQACEEL